MDWPKREKREGSGKFLSLKDGDSFKGMFRGQPYLYYLVWENGKSRECDKKKRGAKGRYRFNFIYRENGALVCKILNLPTSQADILKKYDIEYAEYDEETKVKLHDGLEVHIMSISRTGKGLDTDYQILPAKDSRVTADFLKQVNDIQLHQLAFNKQTINLNNRDENGDPVFTEDEIPF